MGLCSEAQVSPNLDGIILFSQIGIDQMNSIY